VLARRTVRATRRPADAVVAMMGMLLAACAGGGEKPSRTPKGSKAFTSPEEADEEARPARKSKKKRAPKVWYAKAALTPSKGSKLKPVIVALVQTEGEDTEVTGDVIAGLKAGTYHVVVHDGETCGPNGTKAGPPREGTEGVVFVIARDLSGGLGPALIRSELEGDESIVGRALVLHDDKKGRPGKILACGIIESVEADD
jgi:hypothetical protein